MTTNQIFWTGIAVIALLTGGCEKSTSESKTAPAAGNQTDSAAKPKAQPAETAPAKEAVETAPAKIIENPTTNGGRGAPSLTSLQAPAAWIYVDGKEGEFNEEDGRPQVEWMIFSQCTRNPTFRLEAYEPLLGKPDEFQCVLRTHESFDGTNVLYTIKSKEKSFVAGKEYAMLEPGENFVITDHQSGSTITKIPLLSPGVYSMVASVKNSKTAKEGLAVSHFTVGAN